MKAANKECTARNRPSVCTIGPWAPGAHGVCRFIQACGMVAVGPTEARFDSSSLTNLWPQSWKRMMRIDVSFRVHHSTALAPAELVVACWRSGCVPRVGPVSHDRSRPPVLHALRIENREHPRGRWRAAPCAAPAPEEQSRRSVFASELSSTAVELAISVAGRPAASIKAPQLGRPYGLERIQLRIPPSHLRSLESRAVRRVDGSRTSGLQPATDLNRLGRPSGLPSTVAASMRGKDDPSLSPASLAEEGTAPRSVDPGVSGSASHAATETPGAWSSLGLPEVARALFKICVNTRRSRTQLRRDISGSNDAAHSACDPSRMEVYAPRPCPPPRR